MSETAGFMTEAEVLELVPVARKTLYNWEKAGRFPARRKLGERRVGWLRAEVERWIETRPEA